MKSNSQVTRKIQLIFGIVLGISGVGRIWLWHKGLGNDFGLCLGLALCAGSALYLWGVFKGNANA